MDRSAGSLTVLIPAYNEGGAIAAVVRSVRRHLPEGARIWVVDDGSTDETASEARRGGADRVLVLPENAGKGEAIRRGLAAAEGEWILLMDGDGQDSPEDIPRLLASAAGGRDFVNGSRFLGAFEEGAISRLNRWATLFFNALVNALFGTRVTDTQSGFRLARAEVLRKLPLRCREYEVEIEMLLKAIRSGASYAEVPVRRKARSSGGSHFKRWRHGFRILNTILAERFFA